MKAEQFSKNLLALDPMMRFAGVMEKSGHLYAGTHREGIEEYLKGRNSEISYAQSAYIVDKVNLINFPVKDHLLVISTEAAAKVDDICEKILKYITSVENELSLYPPANIVNQEKKEMLQNLHESGISEDMIADQLDLDVNTVKMIIEEIK